MLWSEEVRRQGKILDPGTTARNESTATSFVGTISACRPTIDNIGCWSYSLSKVCQLRGISARIPSFDPPSRQHSHLSSFIQYNTDARMSSDRRLSERMPGLHEDHIRDTRPHCELAIPWQWGDFHSLHQAIGLQAFDQGHGTGQRSRLRARS